MVCSGFFLACGAPDVACVCRRGAAAAAAAVDDNSSSSVRTKIEFDPFFVVVWFLWRGFGWVRRDGCFGMLCFGKRALATAWGLDWDARYDDWIGV